MTLEYLLQFPFAPLIFVDFRTKFVEETLFALLGASCVILEDEVHFICDAHPIMPVYFD